MKRLCVFLRGINVNGISIKTADLGDVFRDMGFADVRTLLATGNVLISVPEDSDIHALKHRIEERLRITFQYDAKVLIRDVDGLSETLAAARGLTVPADCHLYLLICDSIERQAALQETFHTLPHSPGEQLFPVGQDCFWIVAKGDTLKSPFGTKALGSIKFKEHLTSRNMNTIEKIVNLIPQMPNQDKKRRT